MHEVSIVQQIIGTLDQELKKEEQLKVKCIEIHVGELSNVQPILLSNAFEALQKAEQKYTQATMIVKQIPIEIYCSHCKENSSVEKYVFRCKKCNTPSAQIEKGNELLIHKIQF